jgi:hypothetical protein
MIGNDLVDLQQASRDSNWMRQGFLNKLFHEQEQQYIMLADQPSEMVWVLWSMKEAAYKIYNRASGVREFAPVKLKCKLYSTGSAEYFGEVWIDGNIYYTTSEVLPGDYVHSIAVVSPINFNQITRSLYPTTAYIDYKAMRPTCVSHHGRYLALIF